MKLNIKKIVSTGFIIFSISLFITGCASDGGDYSPRGGGGHSHYQNK